MEYKEMRVFQAATGAIFGPSWSRGVGVSLAQMEAAGWELCTTYRDPMTEAVYAIFARKVHI
jgi:hypothetical protein